MALPKLIVIVGPTASGKSELAVKLAKKFNGEVISADSRQIYKGLDIGTGKVPGRYLRLSGKDYKGQKYFIYKGVVHHGVDVVSPTRNFSAAQFKKLALKTISEVRNRGRVPIVCGGTGYWIDAVVFDQNFPEVKPDKRLRKKLSDYQPEQLFQILQQLDPDRAAAIDQKNSRRLIRALEIVMTTGRPVPGLKNQSRYQALWLGLNPDKQLLNKKIERRLKSRLKAGMIKEVERLHRAGISWQRFENLGLEYKYVALYLQKQLTHDEMVTQLNHAIVQYSKRQLTWWKRNKNIAWIKTPTQAAKLIKAFLDEVS